MTIRFDVKITAIAYNSLGTINWGEVSKQFTKEQLQGVRLGNDLGDGKKQIVSPLWPKNQRIWSVKENDIVSTEIDDTPPPSGNPPTPPSEVVLNWRDEAGQLLVTQTYVKKL